MTILGTATNLEARMKALKETVDEEQVSVLDEVVVGDYDTSKMPPGKTLSIRAVTEEGTLDFAGPNPPDSPFSTPWHLTLYVSGQISKATKEVYRIIPLLKASILTDMTFGGSCTEAYWAEPNVIYDEEPKTPSNMVAAARIIFYANYY